MKRQRSFCAGCPDYTLERLEVANMSFDELLHWHKYHSRAIVEYGNRLAKGPITNDPYLDYIPLWLRTHSAQIKFIQDEIEYRTAPIVDELIKEVFV